MSRSVLFHPHPRRQRTSLRRQMPQPHKNDACALTFPGQIATITIRILGKRSCPVGRAKKGMMIGWHADDRCSHIHSRAPRPKPRCVRAECSVEENGGSANRGGVMALARQAATKSHGMLQDGTSALTVPNFV